MKKYLLIISLFLSVFIFSFPVLAQEQLYGDVNDDSTINAKDILIVRQYFLDKTKKINEANADVNLDNAINLKDVLFIRKYLSGRNITLGDKEPDKYDFTVTAPVLHLNNVTTNQICLSWQSSEKWNYIKIFNQNNEEILKTDVTINSYTFTNLAAGQKYTFTIKAYISNDFGIFESNPSTVTAYTTFNAPATTVVGVDSQSLFVTWENNNIFQNADIYISEITKNQYSFYKTFDASQESATISKMKAGTRYNVKVKLRGNDMGAVCESLESAPHYGTTKPADITGIKMTNHGTNSITIAWNSTSGARDYRIFRSKTKDGSYILVANQVKATTYSDTNLNDGENYYYKVQAHSYISPSDYYGNLSSSLAGYTDKKINYIIERYGTSYQGRALEAYIFNPNASKTIFATFSTHGFEDEYYRDGQVLVNCAKEIIKYYDSNLSALKGYRLVIVPCVNPDGAYAGTNNLRACSSAFGRCTANHIDINRDFKTGKFNAKESVALRNLIIKYKPTYYIDFHGWLNSTLGDGTIGYAFRRSLGITGNQTGHYGADNGYIIGYVKETLGYNACLVEFSSPSNVVSGNVIKGFSYLIG